MGVRSDFNKINEQALHKAELFSGLPSMILLFVALGMLLLLLLAALPGAGGDRGRIRACT